MANEIEWPAAWPAWATHIAHYLREEVGQTMHEITRFVDDIVQMVTDGIEVTVEFVAETLVEWGVGEEVAAVIAEVVVGMIIVAFVKGDAPRPKT